MTAIPVELQEIVAKLGHNPQIEGVLLIGSLTTATFNAASDYDIVLFLQAMPAQWYVGVTTINGRFTDLLFVSANLLQDVLSCPPDIAVPPELAPVVRWIAQGAILLDRNQQLQTAQGYVQTALPPPSIDANAAYQAWFGTNYNLAVIRRLAMVADSRYQTTAEIRMAVYGHADLWFNYFMIRRIPWEGDKAALQYLHDHDPAYLAHYQAFIRATDQRAKFAHYTAAAQHATEPLGGLWAEHETVINILDPAWTWADLLDTDATGDQPA